ncbi:MAG: M28 family peptidase [Proteobacteria bacterium]|nr:M28 family peptidase [Pseudomonadota bacterium]
MNRFIFPKFFIVVALVFSLLACDSDDKDVFSQDEIVSFIEDLVSFGYRRPGTEAELKAEQYIMDKFAGFGLSDIQQESFEIVVWDAQTYSLSINEQSIPCFYMPYSAFTPPDGISAELVYLGEGSEEDYLTADVAGKIVVVDMRFGSFDLFGIPIIEAASWYFTNWEAYNLAMFNQAAGFVGILADYFDRNTYYGPVDNPSKPLFERTIPGLWLSRSDGEQLLQIMADQESPQADLFLTGSMEPGETANIIGFIPGKKEEIIMVHSHHDSVFEGAVEDGSGTAEVLALAKYFGRDNAPKLNRTLMFLSSTGHFYNYMGHQVFLEKHMEDLLPRVVADVCVEHIGLEVEEVDGRIVKTGRNNLTGVLATNTYLSLISTNAVLANGLKRTLVIPWGDDEMESDALYYHEIDIPIVSLISAPLYLYDIIDTMDLVAKDQLVPVACALADIITTIDKTPTSWLK